MTKYNGSLISFVDAVDKLFEEAAQTVISTDLAGNCYVYNGWKYPNTTWKWSTIATTTDFSNIDVPSYPVSNGWIKEDGSLFLQIACTGFGKSDLRVKIEDEVLSIRATKGHTLDFESSIKKGWKQLFHNLPTRDFEWKRRMSNKYDLEKLEAKVEKGILEITIPLKEACKPIKKEFEIK